MLSTMLFTLSVYIGTLFAASCANKEELNRHLKAIEAAHNKVFTLLGKHIFEEHSYGYDFETDEYFLQSYIKSVRSSIGNFNDYTAGLEAELPDNCATGEINCLRIGVEFEKPSSLYYPILLKMLLSNRIVLDYKFIGSYKPAKILHIALLKKYIRQLKAQGQRYSEIKTKSEKVANLFVKSVKLYKNNREKRTLEERFSIASEDLKELVAKLRSVSLGYFSRRVSSSGDELTSKFTESIKKSKDIVHKFIECFKFLNLELTDLKRDGNFIEFYNESYSNELSFYTTLPKFKRSILGETINDVEIEVKNMDDLRNKIKNSNINILPSTVKISKQEDFVHNMEIADAHHNIRKLLKKLYDIYRIEVRGILTDNRTKIAYLNNQLVIQRIVAAYEKLSKEVKVLIMKLIDVLDF
eukprot:GAHX01002087.1.p1 GENE.GAHX01002087.1~~GAHX01002087.1.p1  ORF type:complete len:412 (-),score=65.60 GAHX01002087.1:365-1600(-)